MDEDIMKAAASGTLKMPGFVYVNGYDRELALASVGEGWSGIINKVFDDIEELKTNGKVSKDFAICQVKEKFGGLRIYVYSSSDEIEQIIRDAEMESYSVCETCGKKGEARDDLSWCLTLCDEHYEEKIK